LPSSDLHFLVRLWLHTHESAHKAFGFFQRFGVAMLDNEPPVYPNRRYYPLDPGIADRQLWAIGMVVTQWGMAEFIREQEIISLMADDTSLEARYKKLRASQLKNKFWKELIEAKKQGADLEQWRGLVKRFEALNNFRDDIVHRLWGGGMQGGSPGAPDYGETTDAALHRNRDEKVKTKSKDARGNLRWRLSFQGLRKIGAAIALLNNNMLASWLPPNTPPGHYDIFAFTLPNGQLSVGIADRPPEGVPKTGD
jgi:hypothetical protein